MKRYLEEKSDTQYQFATLYKKLILGLLSLLCHSCVNGLHIYPDKLPPIEIAENSISFPSIHYKVLMPFRAWDSYLRVSEMSIHNSPLVLSLIEDKVKTEHFML